MSLSPSPAPLFVDGMPVIARRILPADRRVTIPAGMEALLVRDATPVRSLPAGTHAVRGWLQSTPELYLYQPEAHFLPLWITGLTTADGRSVALGWRLQVQIADVRRLWGSWLRLRPDEWIALPADVISARVADAAAELTPRYALNDLRTDANVRQQIGSRLGALVKAQLEVFGLEVALHPDPLQLRFLTDADQTVAAQERATLQRVLDDERLRTELNRIENAETLAYRLQEAAAARGESVGVATATAMAQQAIEMPGQPYAATLQAAVTAPPSRPTPTAVTLTPVEHRAQHHVFKRLSLLVIIVAILSALTLAAIAILRPEMMATDTQRNQLFGAVVGVAILGVLISWVIDQIIRWQAHQSAERMLIEANLDTPTDFDGRMEARHVLMLLGALFGVGIAAAALWMPDHVNWLRAVGAGVGLLGAAFAIRLDWLHNVNRANAVVAQAQRRIASARLDAAQRTHTHVKLQATLSAELEVIQRRLDESAALAYRNLNDRALNRRLRTLEAAVKTLALRAHTLEQARGERNDAAWETIDAHMTRLQTQIEQASQLAAQLSTTMQQRNAAAALSTIDKLEEIIHNIEDDLSRWTATIV
jgi:hypothetical protein